jgi:polar amino acid transport system substrate-binding protein
MKAMLSKLFAAGLMVAAMLPVAASADDLASIKDAGEIKIAMTGQYPPFNFVNDKNEVVGFDASIGMAIAERLGVKGTIVTTAWDGIIAGLLANKYDTIVGSMTITEERQKAVDFVGPYYHAGRGVFVLELKAGRVDAIVVDNIPVAVAVKETGDKIRQLDTPDIEGGSVAIGIAIRQGNPELKAAMQKALDDMMADGSYEKIAMEWIGRDIR